MDYIRLQPRRPRNYGDDGKGLALLEAHHDDIVHQARLPCLTLSASIRRNPRLGHAAEALTAWRADRDFSAMSAAEVVDAFVDFSSVFDSRWRERTEVIAAITDSLERVNRFGTMAAISDVFL